MKKFLKLLASLAAIGTAVALIVTYFLKDEEVSDSEDDCFSTDDEDLDNDLKPVTEREYVSLNRTDA